MVGDGRGLDRREGDRGERGVGEGIKGELVILLEARWCESFAKDSVLPGGRGLSIAKPDSGELNVFASPCSRTTFVLSATIGTCFVSLVPNIKGVSKASGAATGSERCPLWRDA